MTAAPAAPRAPAPPAPQAQTSRATVDTGKVKRRVVRFHSVADLRADLGRIEAAQRAGTLRTLGNWTPGQIVGHLATWAQFSFDGNPLRPPWIIRFIVGRRKNRYLDGGLPAGVKIPRVPGGTLGMEDAPFDEAMARYRRVMDRLEREAPTRPNVIFGRLTHEEWIKLHLRHAELHLGFLDPG